VTIQQAIALPLADRVPADAVAYVGWRGTNDPGEAYAKSIFADIAAESKFQQLIDESVPLLLKRLDAEQPDADAPARSSVINALIKSAVRYPTAFYVALPEKGTNFVRAGIVTRVPPADRAGVTAAMDYLVTQWGKRNAPRTFAAGDDVAIVWGYAADEMALAGGGGNRPDSISGSEKIKAAVARAGVEPTLVGYADLEAIEKWLTTEYQPKPRDKAEFDKVLKLVGELGLRDAKSFTFTAGFKGREWQTETSLQTSPTRKGVLALTPQKAFADDLLKRVPARSTQVQAVRFDAFTAVQEIKRATSAVDPQWAKQIDQVLGVATMAVGKNAESDLLEPLGDEWVIYNSPDVAGESILGAVVINKLDNAQKAKQGLASLSIFASNSMRTGLKDQPFKIAGATTKVGDLTIYYITTPVIAPSWAIKDGYLYLGLYPQNVAAAANYAGAGIAENKLFAEAMTRTEKRETLSFSFTDNAIKMQDGYMTARLLFRSLSGFGDMFMPRDAGTQVTPEFLLPPLSIFAKAAGPTTSVTFADAAGIHTRTNSPFPGAEALSTLSIFNAYTANAPLTASFMLPSLNRAREAANRIKSASNLKQIGMANLMYANENKDQFANDFGTLIKTQDITPEVFINPRADSDLPANIDMFTPDQKADWVNSSSNYIWIGQGLTSENAPADQPIAFENPMTVDEGINILFGDGHVEWMVFEMAKQEFARFNIDQKFPE